MDKAIGLCSQCNFARRVPHPRQGAEYWRCGYAEIDEKFPRYPRLPVLECPAFVLEVNVPDKESL